MNGGFPIQLFPVLNVIIMPLWAGLLFFPKKKWVPIAIDVFAGFAALLFLINLVPGIQDVWPLVMKPTMEGVMELLSTPRGAFGSWTHFLIGDLWVGRWIVSESQKLAIPHLWIVPILVLTLLFGPVGLLGFLFLRLSRTAFQ